MNSLLILLPVLGVCSVVFLFLGIRNFFRIASASAVVDGSSGDEHGPEHKASVHSESAPMKSTGGTLSTGGGGPGEAFDERDELEEPAGVTDVEFFSDVDMESDLEGETGGHRRFDH